MNRNSLAGKEIQPMLRCSVQLQVVGDSSLDPNNYHTQVAHGHDVRKPTPDIPFSNFEEIVEWIGKLLDHREYVIVTEDGEPFTVSSFARKIKNGQSSPCVLTLFFYRVPSMNKGFFSKL